MLDFGTLLDVGGSEGYKAAMARDFFNIEALSSDISKAACDRAKDLYNIPARPSDMRNLDFDSESFDVVLCSESVEHVTNPKACIEEMLRVAKKAVIITVPHESHEIVTQNISEGEMHGHVNYFDIFSFEYLRARGYDVRVRKILSRTDIIYVPGVLMECAEHILPSIRFAKLRKFAERFPKLTRLIFNKYVAAFFLSKDSWAIDKYPGAWYHGVEALILKDPSILRTTGRRKVSMLDVFNYKVPLLRLEK
jgi:SAM-dependent methyltransferase